MFTLLIKVSVYNLNSIMPTSTLIFRPLDKILYRSKEKLKLHLKKSFRRIQLMYLDSLLESFNTYILFTTSF